MIPRLPLIVGALASITLLGSGVGTAEAGHAHFSGGGGAHFGGGVHFSGGVHFNAGIRVGGGYRYAARGYGYPGRWGVGGHIYVGGGYYRPYYPYGYYPYVPSYYGASYYPVETGVVAAPGLAAPIVARPELPRFGIGLFAGSVNTQDGAGNSVADSSDVGILGRYRLTPGLIVEAELGKTSYNVTANGQTANDVRVDRRLGGSLIYEIGAYNRFAPYVLAGMGVQQAQVNGDYATDQDFAEVGVGLRFAITQNFHIAADIRAGTRSSVSNDMATAAPASGTGARSVTPPTSDSGDSEDYTRARLSAILYF